MKNSKISNSATKLIILTLMLFFTVIALAQTPREPGEKPFSVALFTDPVATDKDGFNIGASVDFQMKYMYFKAQVFHFPNLNGIDLTEITGVPLGFNYHSPHQEYRIYAGVKLGFILRKGVNPLAGLETGLDLNITKSIFIGLMASYDYRTDAKVWGAKAEPYMRASGFVKLGFRF